MNSGFGLKDERKKTTKAKKVNLSFYPEGGNAVVGLRSRIGFKATGENGEDLNITGAVYDSSGELVVGYGLDYDQSYRNLPYVGVLHLDGEA